MKRELINLRDTLRCYGVDRVTCLEHPLAVVLESYKQYFGSYSYMITKILQSYILPGNENIEKMVIDFWNKFLGVDIVRFTIDDDILLTVKKYVDKGLPVLLFGNLIELFYSKHYMTKNWEHLFLCTGYDEEKKLIIIQDDGHLKDYSKYESFCLPEDIVRKMIIKDDFFGDNSIGYTLVKNNKCVKFSDRDILLYLLNLCSKGISYGNYAEIETIKKLHNIIMDEGIDSEHKKTYIETLSAKVYNIIKYKEVFIEELILHLARFDFPEKHQENLRSIRNNLHYIWEKYTPKLLIKCMRGKTALDVTIPEEIGIQESELNRQIRVCIDYLENYMEIDNFKEKKNIKYLTENNQNNIISMKGDDIVFLFNDSNIYNTWIEDECPKVILDSVREFGGQEYLLRTRIRIDNNYLESNFAVGIFIKGDDDMYFGGIDVDDKLVFDLIGKNNLDVNFPFCTDVTLFLEYKDNNIYFGIIKENEKIVKLRRPFYVKKNILFGIACKTWGNGNLLKVTFSDYKVEIM